MSNKLFSFLIIFVPLFYFSQEDPFLWLEEIESTESLNWVKEQNKLTESTIKTKDCFKQMKSSMLSAMNNVDKIDYPYIVGDYVYNLWMDENHVRGIWRRTTKSSYIANQCKWETLIDLDELSKKENKNWVFEGANFLAPLNQKCLIYLSDGGTDENIIREFDVKSKSFVKKGFELPSGKGNVAWLNEDEILIARTFPNQPKTTSGYAKSVFKLKRNEAIDKTLHLISIDSNKMSIQVSSEYINGTYYTSIITMNNFYSKDFAFYIDQNIVKVNLPEDATIQCRLSDAIILKLNSDWIVNEKKFKSGDIVSVSYSDLIQNKQKAQLVYHPNSRSSVESVGASKNFLLLNIIKNVEGQLYTVTLSDENWEVKQIPTEKMGTIGLVHVDRKTEDYFYSYSSFVKPSTIYYVNKSDSKVVRQGKEKFNTQNIEVHQYKVASSDGTLIPYFIIHSKDIKYDGTNPTIVYAYGGFNISVKPYYSYTKGIGWIEKGGVYVIANIRGGGEFGPLWHQAALKEKRQTAYNDFYAVCEDIISKKISSPKHIGAMGWSNGGLMAGVVLTQRPDLFNAVVIGAPLLDMKRFNHLLAGASWMGEYGNPDTDDWNYIQKYSPYQNVFKDKKYPQPFIVTSTKDDRVHPGHARKMAAKMIYQNHPVFYYETLEGGHSAASTNEQSAELYSLIYSYFWWKLK
ncbi:MAG: prolyl oligopeptidase family serine peptidase [Crocinitomicaceae bacterium]